MEVVLIYNGLGNQMSQYAFYLAKKKQCKHCIPFFLPISATRHNGSELDKLFNVHYPNCIIRLFIRIVYSLWTRMKLSNNRLVNIYHEPLDYTYMPSLLAKGKALINIYRGGWHSEHYFKGIENEIKDIFCFSLKNEEDKDFIRWKNKIESSKISVAVHIRRGDFLVVPANGFYNFQGVSTIEYYTRAMNYLNKMRGNCEFFVFSDDLDWCREQFAGNEYNFVDCNNGKKSWRDMYLMSQCKDQINANSTFSWWGAWLSNNKDGIVTHPKEFIYGVTIKDFYPENWIEIS